MKNNFKISAVIILSALVSVLVPFTIFAQSDSDQTTVSVIVGYEVACNSNGVCESSSGENELNCFNDCGCNNNGTCESQRGEDTTNCPNDCEISEPSSSSGGGGPYIPPEGLALYIKNLEIGKITFESAEIKWQTNKPASCATYIGKTSEYEKQTISEIKDSKSHISELTDLDPSTVYHFSITCKATGGLIALTGDRYFTTLYVVSNVSDFTAIAREKEIFLSWQNPDDPNFQLVRLLKKESFYPSGINDGQILYEGNAESFADKNVEISKKYYYAIFAKGKNGSWSSGALASAVIKPTETPVTPVTPGIAQLKLSDFDFYSNGKKIPVINEKTVEPEANEDLIISIDFEKVPKEYKKMFFELDAGKNKFYYLFQLNKEQTVYSVKLVSPLELKTYPLTISFFGQNDKLISKIDGEISMWKAPSPAPDYLLLILIIILIILILILVFIKRKKKKKAR